MTCEIFYFKKIEVIYVIYAVNEEKTYIHYGHTEFEPDKINISNINSIINKPDGGLWASPVDAYFGWKDWCEAENFKRICDEENSLRFSLREGSKILKVRSEYDLLSLPDKYKRDDMEDFRYFPFGKRVQLDFETLKHDGFAAVEYKVGDCCPSFEFWDCDSIVILDPDVVISIIPKKREKQIDSNTDFVSISDVKLELTTPVKKSNNRKC